MSSGPGILQRQVLENLPENRKLVFQRKLLWEIGTKRNEIEITGNLCTGIRTGHLKKSFVENFRRAVKALEENGKIFIEKSKLTELNTLFNYFPNESNQFELFQLRKKLLPSILEYIKENKQPAKIGESKFEEYQIEKIRNTKKISEAAKRWLDIQTHIFSITANNDTEMLDTWIQCLVRGRYLFLDKSIHYKKSLSVIYDHLNSKDIKTKAELNTLRRLQNLLRFAFRNIDWKVGEMKGILYNVVSFGSRHEDSLLDDVKHHLFEKHESLIRELPDHKEPPSASEHDRTKKAWFSRSPRESRKYSPLLDKLITKQVFRPTNRIGLK